MNKKVPEIQINELSSEQKKTMKSRILTGCMMALVGIPALVFGGWVFFVIVMALLVVSCFEFIAAPHKILPWPVVIISYVVVILMTYFGFFSNNFNALKDAGSWENYFNLVKETPLCSGLLYFEFYDTYLNSMFIIVWICILFFMSFISKTFTIHDVAYFFLMTVLISLGFQAVYFLRYYPSYIYSQSIDISANSFKYGQSYFLFLYVLVGVFINDMGAYFTGVLFGRNKVNPRISPKKTWEGVFGGGIISVVFSMGFALIASFNGMEILPIFDAAHWYNILIVSVLMVLLSNLGDFSFSAIKRYFDFKDYGNIFKEHGGVLDRIDSVIFSAIGVSALIVAINSISFLLGL